MYCSFLIFQERKPKPRGGLCPGCPTASELPDPSTTCQCNVPSGPGCHWLLESERLSSGWVWSQRSTTVGRWVSLCSDLSLDFPIWPEGKLSLLVVVLYSIFSIFFSFKTTAILTFHLCLTHIPWNLISCALHVSLRNVPHYASSKRSSSRP